MQDRDVNNQAPARTAWVFPGQGSQVVGMGRAIYERFASARAIFDQADATLGFGLSQLCFEGPVEELTQTENAQPALLTTSVALLAAAREVADGTLPPPRWAAGHSLGEYSALVGVGALSFEDALRLVRQRGELMAVASEGSMAAIMGLDLALLQSICRDASGAETVVVANENSPGQLVISGNAGAVERAMALARQHGAKRVIPLKVSAAFHSPLMHSAATQLRRALDMVAQLRRPTCPVISNITAEPLCEPPALRAELVVQMTSPVRWISVVERMVAEGVTRFVEIGPGSVLTGLIKRIAPGIELVNVADDVAVERWVALERAV